MLQIVIVRGKRNFMNLQQLCELEKNYINFTEYEKPRLCFKNKSLTIYESAGQKVSTLNFYYLFLLDYFVCAFQIKDGVKFYTEAELRNEFSN